MLVLIVSICMNQFLAVRMAPAPPRRRKALLMAGVAVNLLGLAYYKYGTFVWTLSGEAADLLGFPPLPAAPLIPLPLGISFFTFQAVSYLIDVYRREIERRKLANSAYHSLFPQLVAGPIVRYREIAAEMLNRRIDIVMFSEGVYRFCCGLAKKIVIADNLGVVAAMFELPANELTTRGLGWRAGLFAADLFRLLRLFRHGDRPRPDARFHFPRISICLIARQSSRSSGGAGT